MNTRNNTKKSNVCMACSCPCDMHKEHTHGDEHDHSAKNEEGSTTKCEMCGHGHKSDGTCDCGCR